MGFSKLSEIMTYGETHQMPFWQVILEDDCRERNVSESQSLEAMEELLEAMERADAGYDKNLRSAGGMAVSEKSLSLLRVFRVQKAGVRQRLAPHAPWRPVR